METQSIAPLQITDIVETQYFASFNYEATPIKTEKPYLQVWLSCFIVG
ncbi:hypothetical protein [Pontibacter pudoricolor]|nr:hypothetical protein [Pontibacter pudoricolor]